MTAQRMVVVGHADDHPGVALSKCARPLSALLCATPVLVCPARNNPLPVRSESDTRITSCLSK